MLEGKINQLKKTTLSQDIVQQLMELITNGTISPGEKLPSEKELMELFGVGRSTLREATRALAALELIEVRVPEGTFVTESFGGFFTKHLALMSKISFDNIIELIEARVKYETDLAEMAAEKSTPADHQRLDNILHVMKQANTNEEFLRSDLEFHTAIAEIARNSFMLQVMNILRDITKEWMFKVIESSTIQERAIAHHMKIAKAIKDNNKVEAGNAMLEHLTIVSDLLLEYHNKKQ
ncbi:FadR/GntR family transcriptional regulator [Cytobacillus praedii]|uniref:FadR/GntR family transcriptional regulator n=1 Tax=Cytobacillus praedii TaxID=1742358 RepID=UPI002E1E19F7|nr:FadR/GntR family transcriptional regulator [Cytobacillus praedii]